MSRSEKTILMDGAMGTMLIAQGFAPNICLEKLNLTHPDVILKIHRSYLKAGAKVLVTNTFGANRPRLKTQGAEKLLEKINRTGVTLAKKIAGKKAKVFASIGPLGEKMSPLRAQRAFGEQVKALKRENPDGYLVETMTTTAETEAAVQAIRRVSNAKIIACCATLEISDLKLFSKKLRSAGADIIGLNCGTGPKDLLPVAKSLRRMDRGDLCIRPSTGLPGKALPPAAFAGWAKRFQKMGYVWIGGCCGTTPKHILSFKKLKT